MKLGFFKASFHQPTHLNTSSDSKKKVSPTTGRLIEASNKPEKISLSTETNKPKKPTLMKQIRHYLKGTTTPRVHPQTDKRPPPSPDKVIEPPTSNTDLLDTSAALKAYWVYMLGLYSSVKAERDALESALKKVMEIDSTLPKEYQRPDAIEGHTQDLEKYNEDLKKIKGLLDNYVAKNGHPGLPGDFS